MLDYTLINQHLAEVEEKLRPYQVEAIKQAVKLGSQILDMKVGYGKTVCAIASTLYFKPKRVLILCGKNAMLGWRKDLIHWFPAYGEPKHFSYIRPQTGKNAVAKRRELWHGEATFYVTTIKSFLLDAQYLAARKITFDVVIFDEAHRIPKHTTKTFKDLKFHIGQVPHKFFVTGTWVKRNATTGWRQLHLINPKVFSSFWKFQSQFCVTVDNGFGTQIVGPKNTEQWRALVQQYVFRFHVKNNYVPDSVQKFMWTEMSDKQKAAYKALAEDLFVFTDEGEMIIAPVEISAFSKLRRLLASPRDLGFEDHGNAFQGLLEHLEENLDDPDEQHLTIFSPYRGALDRYAEELKHRGYKTFMFRGGMSLDALIENEKGFASSKGKKSVALATVGFAEGYHLGTCVRSHFIGADFDPDPNKQAEGRLARADSDLSKLIVHRYWLYQNTIDESLYRKLVGRSQHVKKLFLSYDELMNELYGQE